MKRSLVFSLVVLLFITATMPLFAQKAPKLPEIKSKEYKLKNGMRVITHVDRSTPVVTVGTWYHVG